MLDLDPIKKLATYFDDNEDGTFNITYEQQVEDHLDGNKRLANVESYSRKGIKKGWWKYASIPDVIIYQWSKEVGGDILSKRFEKELFARLNNPDYKDLKTTHGRHRPKA